MVGETLDRYLRDSGLGERMAQAAVVSEWEARVGRAIARAATPLRVSNGVLVVAVRSSAWLMELKLLEPEILERLNAGRERGRITGLRFVMGQ